MINVITDPIDPPGRTAIIVKGTGYVPIVHPHKPRETTQERQRRIAAALRYATAYLVQPAPDGALDPTRAVFGPSTRGQTADDARRLVRAFYGPRAAFHRVTLSPHAALGVETVDDMIDWTRLTLDAVQDWLQHEWVWVGGIHSNTPTRHAHVIIAGRTRGEGEVVTLTRGLFQRMRDAGLRAAYEIDTRRGARYDRLYGMGV